MSQPLTLELSEQAFKAIQQQAADAGVPPARLAATLIEQRLLNNSALSDDSPEAEAARERFESHFGTLSVEGGTSINNEDIDADLLREYADNHE